MLTCGMFYADYPSLRRVSDIAAMGEPEKPRGSFDHFVKMSDGKIFELSNLQFQELLCRPTQIMPSSPGLHVIRVGEDDGEVWTIRDPVIAWALCLDGTVRPVCPGGISPDWREATYVEMPNGRVFGIGEHADPWCFANEEAMKAHCLHVAKKRREPSA